MSKMNKYKYLLGAIFFIILSVSFIKSTFDVLESEDRLDELKEEVELLEQKKSEIEKEITYKKTDEYVEEKARNELNLIKPGEKVYVVMGGESSSENVLSESDFNYEDDKKDSNWYSWYRLFFDN
ncbi:septum formation initiator family protein [Patescibacteria group bacterium]|nr:septum formation initiator family protein [Patescibacteria group bacterium]